MLAILLLLFFVFNHPVFAIPTVTINSIPDVVTAGSTFPVSFTINEASSSSSYYYKFFGGVDNDVYKITTSSDLSYSSSWSNFPQITLDPTSSNIFNGYAFIKSEVGTGTLNLKIKIALITDTNTKFGATSPAFSVEVVAAPPTSTPTPNEEPTDTPTKTPTSTKIPTATKTSTPTKTPTPTKIATSSSILTPTSISATESAILSTTEPPTPTPTLASESGLVLGATDTTNKKSFLPLILICSGGLFLLTPLIIAKIKNGNQENN